MSSVSLSFLKVSGKHELLACQGPSGPEIVEARKYPNRKRSRRGNVQQHNHASCVECSDLHAGALSFACMDCAIRRHQFRNICRQHPTFVHEDLRSVDSGRFYTAMRFYRGGIKRRLMYFSRILLTATTNSLTVNLCRKVKMGFFRC